MTTQPELGPIYGVELLDSLPLGGGMTQALPSRSDLEGIRNWRQGQRVVAGYEVLLAHYRRLRAIVDRLTTELATARDTNRRLHRRCQEAEAMETEYRHAANAMKTQALHLHDTAAISRWWLDRLRKVVEAAEDNP